ncbi:HDOD domain-containing protein [Methylomarinum sp. Ch1-1]|uniref:HDOD domain-containing protein n=1 Tax=Methylomarinum roseum TaxID=3067653 RepID=A0AAU7NY79_9GAMM|nr:HDOD domain-containing protein [Methylomarinum sp. Ch1-1]MDP4521983.1 HDOD domain-containing protein [Methylomarinum sp. Ch1-1]
MTLINALFKGKKPRCSLSREKVSLQTLKRLIPIRNLGEEKLQAFALEKQTEVLAAGETLFELDSPTDAAIYLLQGVVTLADKNGKRQNIDADSAEARFPLCSGTKHAASAVAKSDISYLRVSHKIMSINDAINHEELVIAEELKNNRLLQLFSQYFINETVEVPSLPNVAIRLRKALQKDIGVAEAVKIIQLDPVISAKLIEVANCPLYLTLNPAKSCFDAVNRIGLNGARNLVVSFSLKQIFKNQAPAIKNYLDRLWRDSLNLSCLCYVLAQESGQQNPEEALLAGLVCDIGAIPFLNFVANLPAEYHDNEEIEQALPAVKGVVGATVLKNWHFADEFIDVALHANDWYRNDSKELSLTDIVVLARLHRQISQQKSGGLPPITSIPAASKLKNIALSPENSLHILHDAKHKINDALAAFSG